MRKIKSEDDVIVLTGRCRGMKGRVLRVIDDGKRLVVEGVNLVKKHMRGNPHTGEKGGIIEKEAPIAVSNVALLNPRTQKADRVGFKEVDGTKRRYFKSDGELVDI